MFVIRKAEFEDIADITKIYNEAILNTEATFDTEPKNDDEQRDWFNSHDIKHPILVAVLDGIITGWASLSNWSDRCAYSDTAEASTYVKEGYRKKGIGRKLFKALVKKGEQVGLHTIICRINADNKVSIYLAKTEGFDDIGVMKEVGRKFGKLIDVRLMQKIYSEAD